MKSDKVKLIVALVIFAIAAVILVIQFDLFGGGGAATPTVEKAADPSVPKRGGAQMAPKPPGK